MRESESSVVGVPLPLGIRLKIERAQEHVNTLEREIAAYREGRHYEFAGDFDSKPKHCLVRFHLLEHPEERWGVILGDVAHNYRSALDHIAWQLVKRYGGRGGRQTKFPIYAKESDYIDWRAPRRACDPRGKWSDPFEGVDEEIVALIESFQPYRREGENDPLAILSAISNRDKHRLLLPTVVAVDFGEPRDFWWYELRGVTMDAIGEAWVSQAFPERLEDKAMLLQAVAEDPLPSDPYVKCKCHVALEVSLPKRGPIGDVIGNMTDRIEEVAQAFGGTL